MIRKHTMIDKLFFVVDQSIKTLTVDPVSSRPHPGADIKDDLTYDQKQHSIALMRINHVGEVCAQGLYLGGYVPSRTQESKSFMIHAMEEEKDHLSWTSSRIRSLGGRLSYLNPLWFTGSFALGLTAALWSDNLNYAFVEETEKQVGNHLQDQIDQIYQYDKRSRAILDTMMKDELSHAEKAKSLGEIELPSMIKSGMSVMALMMKKVAYYV